MKVGDKVKVINNDESAYIYPYYNEMAIAMKAKYWSPNSYLKRSYRDVNNVGVIQCIQKHPDYPHTIIALVRLSCNNTNCEFIIDTQGLELVG